MSGIVKMKRPLSVWLSQVFVILVMIWSGRHALSFAIEAANMAGVEVLLRVDIFVAVLWTIACIVGFVGLALRKNFSRYLVSVLFILAVVFFFYLGFSVRLTPGAMASEVKANFVLALMLVVLGAPPIILAIWLLFSRKAKDFFKHW